MIYKGVGKSVEKKEEENISGTEVFWIFGKRKFKIGWNFWSGDFCHVPEYVN